MVDFWMCLDDFVLMMIYYIVPHDSKQLIDRSDSFRAGRVTGAERFGAFEQ